MVAGDFLTPVLMLAGWSVIGFFVRPHWKNMDYFTKTIVAFIPAMVVVSLIALLLGLAFGYDRSPTFP